MVFFYSPHSVTASNKTQSFLPTKPEVEEQLKNFYRAQDWPSFFSFAQFYRKHWSEKELGDVQLLELLALLRHCQNDVLQVFIDHLRSSQKKYHAELDQIEALSKTQFNGKSGSDNSLQPLNAHLRGKDLWKTDHDKVGKYPPSSIKIKVKNLCP
ncbi:MAG: hypothetical protein J0L93_11265 [Deltaproteobacteria bacterium]|nr:hypothetical protein [Deltaproteobacteria bacterium]